MLLPIGAYTLFLLVLLWGIYRRAYAPLPRIGNASPPTEGRASSGGAGSVYILTNPEHPGLVKIGYTTRSAAARARELSTATGVPQPFGVAFETEVSNPESVEAAVHEALAHRRVNPNREFFAVPVRTAVRTLRRAVGEDGEGRTGHLSTIPARLRRGLETGLGLTILAASLLSGLALVLSGTIPTHTTTGWTSSSTDLFSAPNLSGSGIVGEAMAPVGRALGPSFLGYSGLLIVGLIGLWGVAMLRHRSRRPLWLPTALSVVIAVTFSGTMGWLRHRASAPLWTGADVVPAYSAWSGDVGTAISHGLRAQVGATGALVVLLLLLAATLFLGVEWARRRNQPTSG